MMTPQEILRETLEAPMSDEACEKLGLQHNSYWLRALCLAQLKRALEGDSAAFTAIVKVAYPEDSADLLDEIMPDELSATLIALAEKM